ncbi:MAG: hypothetical protein IJ578_01920 [Bacteroidales bacterium]|nr:hypothetical protein [Bacteroidales bacterium]
MKLEGEIYRVVSRTERQACVDFLPQSRIYAAHFPGHPITPGAVLVRMAAELLGAGITGAKDIRFLSPVPPEARGVLFSFEPDGEGECTVVITGGDTVHAKMRLCV